MELKRQLINDIETLPENDARNNDREAMFGCLRGKYKIADDFDAPLEDFREYTQFTARR